MVRIHTTVSNKIAEDVRRYGWTYAQLVRLGYEQMLSIARKNLAPIQDDEIAVTLKKLGDALGKARDEANYYREAYQRKGGAV